MPGSLLNWQKLSSAAKAVHVMRCAVELREESLEERR